MKILAITWCYLILGARSETAFVDPNYKLVEWTGWGTSLAWFSDVLGGMNQDVQDEINYSLFSVCKQDQWHITVL